MVATVYVDASFLSSNRIGAYAYWIKTHKGSHKLGRLCPGEMSDIALCETYGIYQAVGHALHHYPGVKLINVFSDSRSAVNLLNFHKCEWKGDSDKKAVVNRVHQAYRKLIKKHPDLVVHIQHRSQHNATKHNGTFAHNWCNMMARSVTMQEAERRKQLPRAPVAGPGIGVKGVRALR